MAQMNATLTRMSESNDYEVAADDRDIRGWQVSTGAGTVIGEVDDLLIDPAAMKVRQVEVSFRKGAGAADRPKVAIPIDAVDLDTDARVVIVNGSALGEFSRETETELATGSVGASMADTRTADLSASPAAARRLTRAEEELRIGKRSVQTGEVRVGKHVKTEQVQEPVTLEKERVTIERRPVNESTSADIRIGDQGEIVVPIMEEQAVVEKRAVVKEEIVVSKERVATTEQVQAEVRKEEFDIDENGTRKAGR